MNAHQSGTSHAKSRLADRLHAGGGTGHPDDAQVVTWSRRVASVAAAMTASAARRGTCGSFHSAGVRHLTS
jgi:hypothetical protein